MINMKKITSAIMILGFFVSGNLYAVAYYPTYNMGTKSVPNQSYKDFKGIITTKDVSTSMNIGQVSVISGCHYYEKSNQAHKNPTDLFENDVMGVSSYTQVEMFDAESMQYNWVVLEARDVIDLLKPRLAVASGGNIKFMFNQPNSMCIKAYDSAGRTGGIHLSTRNLKEKDVIGAAGDLAIRVFVRPSEAFDRHLQALIVDKQEKAKRENKQFSFTKYDFHEEAVSWLDSCLSGDLDENDFSFAQRSAKDAFDGKKLPPYSIVLNGYKNRGVMKKKVLINMFKEDGYHFDPKETYYDSLEFTLRNILAVFENEPARKLYPDTEIENLMYLCQSDKWPYTQTEMDREGFVAKGLQLRYKLYYEAVNEQNKQDANDLKRMSQLDQDLRTAIGDQKTLEAALDGAINDGDIQKYQQIKEKLRPVYSYIYQAREEQNDIKAFTGSDAIVDPDEKYLDSEAAYSRMRMEEVTMDLIDLCASNPGYPFSMSDISKINTAIVKASSLLREFDLNTRQSEYSDYARDLQDCTKVFPDIVRAAGSRNASASAYVPAYFRKF